MAFDNLKNVSRSDNPGPRLQEKATYSHTKRKNCLWLCARYKRFFVGYYDPAVTNVWRYSTARGSLKVMNGKRAWPCRPGFHEVRTAPGLVIILPKS